MLNLDHLGLKTTYLTQEEIDLIYLEKFPLDVLRNKLNPGDCLLVKATNNPKSSVVLLNTQAKLTLLNNNNIGMSGFSPRDVKQFAYFNILKNPDFSLVTALGSAGTGKTTVAMANAIDDYFQKKRNIILTKPTHIVSSHENNAFGPVPGDIDEKYAPYVGSFEIVLKKVLGDSASHYYNMMKEKKHLQFMPVEFTRGCTFENCTFILDEVQNMTWHELKTVLSRIGDDAKIILCGDPYQIDANLQIKETGIYKLLTSQMYQSSKFTSTIILTKQYRGKIPDLVYHIDKE